MGYVSDEAGTDGGKCRRKVASGRRVASDIRSRVNARDLEVEYARVLHLTLIVPVLKYGIETMLWKEKEVSRIRAVQMDNFLGIKRMDSVPNAQIKELCGVTKGVDERLMKIFSDGFLMWRG